MGVGPSLTQNYSLNFSACKNPVLGMGDTAESHLDMVLVHMALTVWGRAYMNKYIGNDTYIYTYIGQVVKVCE